jgi:hypothetical protein
MLLGDGGLLLCSGGVFFGVRSGGNDIFDIYYCSYAAGAFSLGSVLGLLFSAWTGRGPVYIVYIYRFIY